MKADFDVGVIGGGPGGAAVAAYVARAGLSCAVFERDLFPRPHVGESLVPSSTRVFDELGFLDKMESSGFPRKYGAAWTAPVGKRVYDTDWGGLTADEYAGVRFSERQQPGVHLDYTWHVDRGRFDLMLLQHANEQGAHVYSGVTVRNVDMSDPTLPRIQYKVGSRDVESAVRVVVDASGRRTLLGSRMGLRVRDPVFDQYALHTWFENYDRKVLAHDSDRADYIFVHFLPITDTWVWQIPITDSITSIGVVTQKKNFATSRQAREEFFWRCLESRPELAENLRRADQVRPLKDEGDYSYACREICGDGFVLVGDAARFVDPIFSTGVSIALNGARFASQDIIQAAKQSFAKQSFAKPAFANYERTLRRGTKNWYDFISVYYRLNVLFTAFVNHPDHRRDVLKLLQGDVYDEDQPPVITRMREIIKTVEADPNHIWHPHLGSLTADMLRTAF